MNNFDKQRIENAIWILEQYDYEIRQKEIATCRCVGGLFIPYLIAL